MSSLKISTSGNIGKLRSEDKNGGQSPLINTWVTNDSENASSSGKKEGDRCNSLKKNMKPLETTLAKDYKSSLQQPKYSQTPQ